MRIKIILKTCLILLFIFFVGCSNDDDNEEDTCVTTFIGSFEDVEAPKIANVNMPVSIATSTPAGGCDRFNQFISVISGTEIDVQIELIAEGCICPTHIFDINEEYIFTPTETGIYTLNFRTFEDLFTTVSIKVTN